MTLEVIQMTSKNRQGINIVVVYVAVWIAVLIIQFVLILPYMDSVGNIVMTEAQEYRLISITNLVLYSSVSLIFVIMLRSYLKDQFIYSKNNFHDFIKITILGLSGLFAAVLLTTSIMEFIGITENSNNQEVLNSLINAATFDKVALIIFSVFFAPFVEEIVFRRAVFGFFEKTSIPLAILISGLSFGFIHVLSGDYVQLIIYGSLGLALAYTYYRSNKNIMTVIAIHMIYNLIVTIIMFTY
jgi:membrane protease YdiL (CAAX protease family)